MISQIQKKRYGYQPGLPKNIESGVGVYQKTGEQPQYEQKLKEIFSQTLAHSQQVVQLKSGESVQLKSHLKVGVIFSGGQASGGHNVICGLWDSLQRLAEKVQLIGFLGGPSGLINNQYRLLDEHVIAPYRNTGGFDMIGSGRTKIKTEQDFQKSEKTVLEHQLDILVIIGGDDSNTNAALLAEYFFKNQLKCAVVGVPKTIDGDLKNQYIQTSFGFDTATKIYSEIISNIARDAISAKKYWHFVKLMGRSASHIALECALKTQVNCTLISEELAHNKQTLEQIVDELTQIVIRRAQQGKDFGIILIPEGLIEFIPEVKHCINQLNQGMNQWRVKLDTFEHGEKLNFLKQNLDSASWALFESFPENIQKQLLNEPDPHGNVQVSAIETEKLIIDLVSQKLKRQGQVKFSPVAHFLGYEGRAGFPSDFDCDYCYCLGYNAAILGSQGYSGYMSCVQGLTLPVTEWQFYGIPLVGMMGVETRLGKDEPVISKALVDLQGKPFQYFQEHREEWALGEHYIFNGPIQLDQNLDRWTRTILLENER